MELAVWLSLWQSSLTLCAQSTRIKINKVSRLWMQIRDCWWLSKIFFSWNYLQQSEPQLQLYWLLICVSQILSHIQTEFICNIKEISCSVFPKCFWCILKHFCTFEINKNVWILSDVFTHLLVSTRNSDSVSYSENTVPNKLHPSHNSKEKTSREVQSGRKCEF